MTKFKVGDIIYGCDMVEDDFLDIHVPSIFKFQIDSISIFDNKTKFYDNEEAFACSKDEAFKTLEEVKKFLLKDVRRMKKILMWLILLKKFLTYRA